MKQKKGKELKKAQLRMNGILNSLLKPRNCISQETKVPDFWGQKQSKIIAHNLEKKITIKAQLVTLLRLPSQRQWHSNLEGALHGPKFQHVGRN